MMEKTNARTPSVARPTSVGRAVCVPPRTIIITVHSSKTERQPQGLAGRERLPEHPWRQRLLLFVLWELVGTESPAVDLRILGSRARAAGWVSIGIVGFGLIGGLVLQSLFLQQALGYTAMQTGLNFLPRGLVTMLITPAAGIVTSLIGPRYIVAPGLMLAASVMVLMSRWTRDAGYAQIVVPMLLLGLAPSLLLVPLFGSALNSVPRAKATGAAGLMNLMFQLGGSRLERQSSPRCSNATPTYFTRV